MPLWDRIDAELDRRGLPWSWLGRAIGSSDQAMHNWKTRGIPPARHKAIADALSWSVDRLLADATEEAGESRHATRGVIVRPVSQSLSHLVGDDFSKAVPVPVIYSGRPSTAGGITLQRLESGGVVAAAFVGPRAYAVKVTGDGLHPVVRHGCFVVCDPGSPPVQGELVLLHLKDGSTALREFAFERAGEITTLAVLGGGRETIEFSAVERMDPVAMIVSSSRWREA